MVGWALAALAAPEVVRTTPLVPGAPAGVEVVGVAPGSDVRLFVSLTGPGAGPCQGATCLGVLRPVEVGSAVAGPDGVAVFGATVPPGARLGPLWMQAVQEGPVVVGPVLTTELRTPARVLTIGDSVTAGTQSAPVGDPYPEVLGANLGPAWEVLNLGCIGASSADWDPASPRAYCSNQVWLPNVYGAWVSPELPADLATVLIGTNDSMGYNEPTRTSAADYRAHLLALVDRLHADGVDTVVLMTPPPQCATANPNGLQLLDAYTAVVADLCATTPGTVCGPDVQTLLEPADFDGCNVHPNGAGNTDIADALTSTVLALPPP